MNTIYIRAAIGSVVACIAAYYAFCIVASMLSMILWTWLAYLLAFECAAAVVVIAGAATATIGYDCAVNVASRGITAFRGLRARFAS